MVTWSIGANQTSAPPDSTPRRRACSATSTSASAAGLRVRPDGRHRHGHHDARLRARTQTGERLLDAVRALVDRVPDPLSADVPGALVLRRSTPTSRALTWCPAARPAPGSSRSSVRPASCSPCSCSSTPCPKGPRRLTYWGITGIGTIVTLLVGLWFYERSRRRSVQTPDAVRTERTETPTT